MLNERGLNNEINHLHEKTLLIAYKYELSDFETMLQKNHAVTIHAKSLQVLMTEVFKTQHSLNPISVKEIYVSKNNQYALTNEHPIKVLRSRTTTFEGKSISFLGGKLWQELSVEIKQSLILNQFKSRIKYWKTEEYTCHLSRRYVAQVGYI